MWSPAARYMASARRDPVADEEEKRLTVRGGARVQKLRVERKGLGVLPSTSGHWICGGCDLNAAAATTAGVGAMPKVERLGFWEEVLNGEGRDSGENRRGGRGRRGQRQGSRGMHDRGGSCGTESCVTGKAGQKKGKAGAEAGARGVVDALLTFLIGVQKYRLINQTTSHFIPFKFYD